MRFTTKPSKSKKNGNKSQKGKTKSNSMKVTSNKSMEKIGDRKMKASSKNSASGKNKSKSSKNSASGKKKSKSSKNSASGKNKTKSKRSPTLTNGDIIAKPQLSLTVPVELPLQYQL